MKQLTIYRVKGRQSDLILLFKYDLNGNFKVLDLDHGDLNENQQLWLFDTRHFPSNEVKMQFWAKSKDFTDKFEVEVSPASITFEALWEMYNHKLSRKDAVTSFNKLKESDVIKCFIEVPYYLEYLKQNQGIGKLHLATYINKRRFEDERVILKGKNSNPMLANLAFKKTDKSL